MTLRFILSESSNPPCRVLLFFPGDLPITVVSCHVVLSFPGDLPITVSPKPATCDVNTIPHDFCNLKLFDDEYTFIMKVRYSLGSSFLMSKYFPLGFVSAKLWT